MCQPVFRFQVDVGGAGLRRVLVREGRPAGHLPPRAQDGRLDLLLHQLVTSPDGRCFPSEDIPTDNRVRV